MSQVLKPVTLVDVALRVAAYANSVHHVIKPFSSVDAALRGCESALSMPQVPKEHAFISVARLVPVEPEPMSFRFLKSPLELVSTWVVQGALTPNFAIFELSFVPEPTRLPVFPLTMHFVVFELSLIAVACR